MVKRLSGQADPRAHVRENVMENSDQPIITNTASGFALHLLLDTEPFADGLS